METKNTLTLADYKKKNRRQLITPGGLKVEVRSLSVADFISIGRIPQAFMTGNSEAIQKEMSEGDVAFVKTMTEHILLNCIKLLDGGKLVNKAPIDTAEDELSLSELSQEDSTFLVKSATEQTGFSKEASTQLKPFPEKPGTSSAT